MGKTIRIRLTLWYIVLLAVILLGFSGALYVVLARALYQQLDDALTHTSRDLAEGLPIIKGQIAYPGGENDLTDLEAVRAQGYLVRVVDTTGTVLTTNATYAPLPISTAAATNIWGRRGRVLFTRRLDAAHLCFIWSTDTALMARRAWRSGEQSTTSELPPHHGFVATQHALPERVGAMLNYCASGCLAASHVRALDHSFIPTSCSSAISLTYLAASPLSLHAP